MLIFKANRRLEMNRGGFSWSRFFGISATKSKISRKIGVPLTRSGRQRKAGSGNILAIIATLLLDRRK